MLTPNLYNIYLIYFFFYFSCEQPKSEPHKNVDSDSIKKGWIRLPNIEPVMPTHKILLLYISECTLYNSKGWCVCVSGLPRTGVTGYSDMAISSSLLKVWDSLPPNQIVCWTRQQLATRRSLSLADHSSGRYFSVSEVGF